MKKPLSKEDIIKNEIAEELGLMEKVRESGWRSLTARESGRLGGIISRERRRRAGD